MLASVDTDELNSELNSLLAEKAFVNEEVKRLLTLRKQNAVSASEYERNKSQSSQLKAAIIRVRQLLEAASIVAPYDGIVISRLLELGEFAALGQTILEIAPIKDNLVINVDVLGSELRYLNYGVELPVSARDKSNSQLAKVKN
ncbi:HlyD family efflux transporter periplasmic adaptor subunit [Psychrosphaera algicola]|uniref:HlyD family efflux transporter periplasmic adaptor subunit n=1 Tax=Psychrosphaera algicola TaxID=3023714 RepID=A0ABT5FG12_9GAMM|nr:HlyD family efflux transporter periplasmic adaptor subunit [Psychrosphaera sp. G1-22]MDC2889989.1 HlyD family efflux transporter periplasmic adaptor subunit [Psychrosphaera sp. G1-22]